MAVLDFIASLISKLVVVFLVLFIGVILGRIFGKVLSKLLLIFEIESFIKRLGFEFSVDDLCSKLANFFCIFWAVIFSLKILEIFDFVYKLFLICLISFLFFALTLKVCSQFPNFLSGIKIKYSKKVFIGKKISVNDIFGEVICVGFFETKLKTENGDFFIIPNQLLK